MRSTTVGSTLLLLASAVAAQTTVPAGPSSVCYEVCVQEPCSVCTDDAVPLPVPTAVTLSSVPPVSLPSPIDVTFEDETMTLPVVSLPSVGSEPVLTMTLPVESLPSVGSEPVPTATATAPEGETPESTSAIQTSSGSGSSASRSAPAEQTTAAAPPSLKGERTPFMMALGVSGVSILFGAAWTLL